MIWIWAERDGVDQPAEYDLIITVHPGDPLHRIVRLQTPSDGRIRVDLSGPHAQLEKVKNELAGANAKEPLVGIDVDPSLPAGSHQISLDTIKNDPLFVENGITVSSPVPSEITVAVDQLDQGRVGRHGGIRRTSRLPPAFEPRKGPRAKSPSSLIAGNPKYAAGRAQFDSFDIKTPGTHDLANVPVAISRVPSGRSGSTIRP